MNWDVELRGLGKSYSGKKAVDGVDLEVARGEFLTLLGPSGCGKTSILRLIAGFEEPDEGAIRIGGEDVTGLPPYRRNVNTVFQHYSLFPHLTVFENVAFGLEIRKLARADVALKVETALALVRLSGYERRSPRMLSGGEMQRVALARALVLEPRVLLLDEPLAALDLKLRKEMQVELAALQEKLGITFIFVTHDQEEALVMSDRIAVMRAGRIEQLGDVSSIYERPATRFVADFMGVRNFFRCRVDAVDAGEARLTSEGGLEIRLPSSPHWKAGADVLVAVRPEKIHLGREESRGRAFVHAEGVLLDEIYLGATTQWVVKLNEVETVVADEPNRRVEPSRFKRGDRVDLAFPAEACLELREG